MLISIVIKEGIIINTNELTEYLSDNSNVLDLFGKKILAHLQQMNEQRQPAKRYNEAQLRRKTEKHLKEFIRFFDDNRVIEELELSIAEMEFAE